MSNPSEHYIIADEPVEINAGRPQGNRVLIVFLEMC